MDIFSIFRDRKRKLNELSDERNSQRKKTARIRIRSRIDEVCDQRSTRRLFGDISAADPLGFPDYAEKVASLQKRSNLTDAFICCEGRIHGRRVVCVELIAEFMMGSMGSAVGQAVARSAEYAREQRIPLIIFSASGGARMQEGMFSLMQMAHTAAAIKALSDEGGLYISVLTNPTYGGVTASFAMLGDIILAESGSMIGFAGPRVIEQTIGSKLPEGFQSADFQRMHGFVDAVVERGALRATLTQLLELHPEAQLATPAVPTPPATPATPAAYVTMEQKSAPAEKLKPQEHVELARHSKRPHFSDFIEGLFDDYFELHGDRQFGDDRALVGGIAHFEGIPVTVAGHTKGNDLTSNLACNFGMPQPEGYRKFIRLATSGGEVWAPPYHLH